jgi:Nucleotidyl transferase AbiEii toxin, Type IV TA system
MFAAKLETLPAAQQSLWPNLSFTKDLGFTLYGGTAIAIQLGHRISVDFDFFSPAPLNKTQIFQAAPFFRNATVIQDEVNSLTLLVAEPDTKNSTVKISFFGLINFGHYEHPHITDDSVLRVASLNDLLATKLKAILRRAEAKDYIDIAALLRSGLSLAKGLAIAQEMFRPSFQPSESLKALTYFNDGDLGTIQATDRAALVSAAAKVRELPAIQLIWPYL